MADAETLVTKSPVRLSERSAKRLSVTIVASALLHALLAKQAYVHPRSPNSWSGSATASPSSGT
eukprot:8562064-Alexandrium_andersonii.AAC.1